jgi:hypothetical protein
MVHDLVGDREIRGDCGIWESEAHDHPSECGPWCTLSAVYHEVQIFEGIEFILVGGREDNSPTPHEYFRRAADGAQNNFEN